MAIIKHPDPASIVNDNRLTPDEKKKILKNREEDEKALLRADDENMPRQDGDDAPGNELARLQRAERKLERKE